MLNESVAAARQIARGTAVRSSAAPDFLSLLKTRLENTGLHPEVPSGIRVQDLAAEYLNRMDRNGDGLLSRSEFDGRASWFGQLDRDEDGKLSLAELQAPFEQSKGLPL